MKHTVFKDSHNINRTARAYMSRANNTVLFYTSVGFFVLALVMLIWALIVQQNSPKTMTAAVPMSGYSVHTPVTMGLASMEFTDVAFSDGQPGFTAPSGMHYIIVDFMVKNNSDRPIDVLPSNDTYAKDQAGNVSYLTPFGLKQPFRAGLVLPGEQIKGQLSYLTKKTGAVKIYVDSIWSGGVVPFKVQ